MIALNKAESDALDMVGEARRLRAVAEHEGGDAGAWKRAHDAAFEAWVVLRDLTRDLPYDARPDMWQLRTAMLREAREAMAAGEEARAAR